MNKQEAIKTLREWRGNMAGHGVPSFGEKCKALGMAIEALKKQTVYEQVKWERDMALQTLEEHGIGLGQKNGWIPVSERLPEGDDNVLVTIWWGYGNPEVWVIDYVGVTRGAEEGQIADEKILAHILAWQPLPEPYKGGDDNE